MLEIYLKYNPYKIESEIQVNGEPIKDSSALNYGDHRLQEWVDRLPKDLVIEFRTGEFNITFYGTQLDYDDLCSALETANQNGVVVEDGQLPIPVHMTSEHIQAKEVRDKEQLIQDILTDIENGPLDELKQPDVINAFKLAQTTEFPINVIATMSAGKSTLINAMLGRNLMPASAEACTATITEIKDRNNDNFFAEAYDEKGTRLESHPTLTLDIMRALNNDPQVSKVVVLGNIPFVSSDDVQLTLVDTPGPNNSRNIEHYTTTWRALSSSSKTLVLFILNAAQLGTKDEDEFLNAVAQSMQVGGRQSRDRFIFVVNKLDDFKKSEDNVESSIQRVREHLEGYGIKDPNIFPASALTALYLQTVLKNVDLNDFDMDNEEVFDAVRLCRKLNGKEDFHFEVYAPLTPSARGEVNNMLRQAKETGDKKAEAFVHSGIPSIEAAIRTNVEKYAKTAKIKGIYDTFSSKLQSQKSFENMKKAILENNEKRKEIRQNIDSINAKLNDARGAQEFISKIDGVSYQKEIDKMARNLVLQFQQDVERIISPYSNEEKIPVTTAKDKASSLSESMRRVVLRSNMTLEKNIFDNMQGVANDLMNQYKDRIKSLTADLPKTGEITIDPFELISESMDSLMDYTQLMKDSTSEEEVSKVVGSHKVYHEVFGLRRWLNEHLGSIFHFDVDYDTVDDTSNVTEEFVNMKTFASRYSARIQSEMMQYCGIAKEYANGQVNKIKAQFKAEFQRLDDVLKVKMDDLTQIQENEKEVDKILQKTQENMEWLESIQKRVESITDI